MATDETLPPTLTLDQQIEELAGQGMSMRQIAAFTFQPFMVIKGRINRLRRAGSIPSARVSKNKMTSGSHTLTDMRTKYGIRTGTMADVAVMLTKEEINWVQANVPKGATLADFIALLIRDAAAEDSM
jgi:transposase